MFSSFKPGPGIKPFKFVFNHNDPNAQAYAVFGRIENTNLSVHHIAGVVAAVARNQAECDGVHIEDPHPPGHEIYFLFARNASDVISRETARKIAKGSEPGGCWGAKELKTALHRHWGADCFLRLEKEGTAHIVPISQLVADEVLVVGRGDFAQHVPSPEVPRLGPIKKLLQLLRTFP